MAGSSSKWSRRLKRSTIDGGGIIATDHQLVFGFTCGYPMRDFAKVND
ncbi:MAG: hypothetical protein ACAF41_09345 [Leptolyngbya sp. BL-A-14]